MPKICGDFSSVKWLYRKSTEDRTLRKKQDIEIHGGSALETRQSVRETMICRGNNTPINYDLTSRKPQKILIRKNFIFRASYIYVRL